MGVGVVFPLQGDAKRVLFSGAAIGGRKGGSRRLREAE